MNIKSRVVFGLIMVQACMMQAKSDGTVIGNFEIGHEDLAGKSKTFINNSKYDLVIRWKLFEPGTAHQYAQEPIIKRGDRLTLKFHEALKYLEGAHKMDMTLEILRVRRNPKGAGHPLITTKMKDGSLALAIHKSKFTKNDTFTLSLNKNGLLVCTASRAA